MAVGKSEFAGGGGLVQEEQLLSPTAQQQMWLVYATNPAGTTEDGGSQLLENARDRLAQPAETYTPDSH